MDSSPNNICAICLENIEQKDKKTDLPSCSHTFHSSCFFKFINYDVVERTDSNINCPLCRETCISIPIQQVQQIQPQPQQQIYTLSIQNVPADQDHIESESERKNRNSVIIFIILMNFCILFYSFYSQTQNTYQTAD